MRSVLSSSSSATAAAPARRGRCAPQRVGPQPRQNLRPPSLVRLDPLPIPIVRRGDAYGSGVAMMPARAMLIATVPTIMMTVTLIIGRVF